MMEKFWMVNRPDAAQEHRWAGPYSTAQDAGNSARLTAKNTARKVYVLQLEVVGLTSVEYEYSEQVRDPVKAFLNSEQAVIVLP